MHGNGGSDCTCSAPVDCSAPDASGALEDAYEYDIYRFLDGERCLIARSYIDTPSEAHFLSIDVAGESRLLKDADLLESLWLVAQSQLRREGKLQLRWLSGRDNGYEPVPADSTPLE
ncbi:hypothetical protein J7431_08680 [Xanthomonas phaseoli pv. dieffenbachiae]|uniref:hypothetical protein n=1 Tax=Xanthomonas citri TaxID=346 RepID=UPI000710082B|nr:hypothetical protein [Xanthomonas phaseoli pv. dieffenbachiae]MBO9751617.1 hypothetical protein [Xanthomonas phaseoli pv. dieffenbachiae]MBO9876770.1 hypothetical protein [Xanthomonas sp. D-99]MBO9891747.1 hypothetical protein [Xanthomonas sp. D-36-1]OQP73458.1 hypothetical protein IB69_002665 [Xanthomonas citri]